MRRLSLALFAFALLFTGPAHAAKVVEERIETDHQDIRLLQVADGLKQPWALAFLPGGDMLVTEKSGRLLRVSGDGTATEISGVPRVVDRGQGGLLDVALHPDFEDNGIIYLTYSKPADTGRDTAAALARARLDGNTLERVEDIFIQNIYSGPGRHYGSRLAFTPDGKLLMSIGDRGSDPLRAQDLRDHAGSLLRLELDGSVPDDNPFVGLKGVAEEIFSYGHRNIQGMVVDPNSGAIWTTEHGPRGGDELNLTKATLNYGWPVVSYGRHYRKDQMFGIATTKDGMEPPVRQWTPSPAFSGLALVTGDKFPAWKGNLILGALRAQHIRRVAVIDGKVTEDEVLLEDDIGRVRDVREGPDGHIYILTESGGSGIYRVEPAR